MTDHHPLQQALAIRAADADVSAKRLEELQARKRETKARVHELGNAAGSARDVLRAAAGASAAGDGSAKDVAAARKALKELESEAELAGIELEGIGERVQLVEGELAGKRRAMCLAGCDVCAVSVAIIEEQARATFARFAELMRDRHQLAKLAASLMTEAAGHVSEPIRVSDENAGQLRRHDHDEGFEGVLREHGLTRTFGAGPALAPAVLGDLLELELPRAAEAAE